MNKANQNSTIFTFLRAAKLFMENPSLMIYGLISVVLTLFCFIGMIFLMIYGAEFCIDAFSSWLGIENWGTLIRWITYAGLAVGFFFFFFFTFVIFAGIISIPFMDMLSASIEQKLCPHNEDAPFWLGVRRGIGSSLLVMFRMLLIMIISLPLLFIPVLGTLVYFCINAWYAGFGYLDFPMGRRGWSFAEKKSFLQNYKKSQFYFGAATYALSMLPILNLVVIPWATATATLIFINIKQENCELITAQK